VKEATINTAEIMRWWARWPNANIGIACGEISGVVVLDIDPRHSGDKSVQQLEQMRGLLPATHRVMTGGGGYHLFFKYPETGCRNRNNWLPGVDVRSNGYYVVAPPSVHKSGLSYRWSSPEGLSGFAELPVDVLENIGSVRSDRNYDTGTQAAIDALAGVPEGQRDTEIFRLACSLHRTLRGDREAIEACVLISARRCNPPFPEAEALKKVDQAFKQDHSDPARIPARAADDEIGKRHLTDLGNAKRFVDTFGENVLWTGAVDWLHWDGRRWAPDQTKQIQCLAHEVTKRIWVEALAQEDQDQRDHLLKWAGASEASSKLQSMLRELGPMVARVYDDFNLDPWLLNLENGTLDLKSGELKKHEREDLITKIVPVIWNENARCPEWERFLERILPDPALRAVLQRGLGYSLTGVTREKKMFILRGEGDNGKTVLTDVVRMILGGYGAAAAKALFILSSRSNPDYELASLAGVRFSLAAEEIARGEKLNAGLVKSMTGGDRMKARNPYGRPFEFTPELKLWLATNHLPTISDFGNALWQRLCVFPFDVRIPKEEQVARDVLIGRLMEEKAGILAWMVRGCREWQDMGLCMTMDQELLRESWKTEEKGHILDFIEEVLVKNDTGFTSHGVVQAMYVRWCAMHGEQYPLGRNKLKGALEDEGWVYGRMSGHGSGWRCDVRSIGVMGM
jgi:putative DNA primase/helicase